MNTKTEYYIEVFISFLVGIITLWYIPFVVTSVHKYMMIDYKDKYDKLVRAPFSIFKYEFNKVDWVYDPQFKTSLFGNEYSNNYFHANIIVINRIGYLFTSYGLYRARALRDKKIKELKMKTPPQPIDYKFQ